MGPTSGSLPGGRYHRTTHLGEGTFGSVVTVYNDDGEEFALKLFLPDAEEDDDESEDVATKPMDLGALREISCLRLLRADNRHPSIVEMVDVQTEWSEDEEHQGAGTAGCLGVALPLFRAGSLDDAIKRGTFRGYPKRVKVRIAHGLLSAVAFLHENGILHRDIKSDNVLLRHNEETDEWLPVLIDFSLAKPIDETMWREGTLAEQRETVVEPVQHTGEVGTVMYTAPEIVNNQAYGKPSDLWSVGVVLLELLQNASFTAVKPKEAALQIEQALGKLPDAPFPGLVRSLLKQDASERLTARQALEHAVFQKFGMAVPERRILNVAQALPYDSEEEEENEPPSSKKNGKKSSKRDSKLERRMKMIDRLCSELNSTHPFTRRAALEYSQQLEQLDDSIDNTDESQSLLDCVVLANRFFELDVLDLEELDETEQGRFASWSLEEYIDNEATLFMILDYCLYPRRLE